MDERLESHGVQALEMRTDRQLLEAAELLFDMSLETADNGIQHGLERPYG